MLAKVPCLHAPVKALLESLRQQAAEKQAKQ